MATILVIIPIVNILNVVHFRTVNAQKPSPKGEATALSAYIWILAWFALRLFVADDIIVPPTVEK